MSDPSAPLTNDELEAINAQYRPFPEFHEWASVLARPTRWDESLAGLEALIEAQPSEDSLRAAVTLTTRAAAFETGAIEGLYATDRGLTRTVAAQSALWEDAVRERGEQALKLFDAQMRTYELVLDASTSATPVSEAWIRRLHEELTGPQDTYTVQTPAGPQEHALAQGKYKRFPNHVQTQAGEIHAYAPPADVPSEMHRLVETLHSPEFDEAHPVVQASYAHYALVAIHPFADGNGRVARALASVYLYRAARVPFLVTVDDRDSYFDALRVADSGSSRPFVYLTETVARDAVEMVRATLDATHRPSPELGLKQLEGLMTGQGGLTHGQFDGLARATAEHLHRALEERIREMDWPAGVGCQVIGLGGYADPDLAGYRSPIDPSPRGVALEMTVAAPADASADVHFQIYVSTNEDVAESILVRTVDPSGTTDTVLGLREVHPKISLVGQQRLASLVEREVGIVLNSLLDPAAESLKRAGYLR